jgi:hypothetical protein
MDSDTAPPPARPKLNPFSRALRRERIFDRRRLGWSYADIAREEGVSEQRIQKIVSDPLKRREVEDLPDHALIQLMRLEGAQALAVEAVSGGDLKAIPPFLQILERLDRYRKAAARKGVYDAAARQRPFAKMNRIVARLEAAARKTARRVPAEPREEANGATPPISDVSL